MFVFHFQVECHFIPDYAGDPAFQFAESKARFQDFACVFVMELALVVGLLPSIERFTCSIQVGHDFKQKPVGLCRYKRVPVHSAPYPMKLYFDFIVLAVRSASPAVTSISCRCLSSASWRHIRRLMIDSICPHSSIASESISIPLSADAVLMTSRLNFRSAVPRMRMSRASLQALSPLRLLL